MPTLRPRNRASESSLSFVRSSPATLIEPVSARSRPASTISRVDLPEPEGPTRPIASPLPISRSISFRIWTRAAPWPSERLTPDRMTAGPEAGLGFCMEAIGLRDVRLKCDLANSLRARPWSYGTRGSVIHSSYVAILVLLSFFTFFTFGKYSGARADTPLKIVAFGDSLTAGYGLPAKDAFPAKFERALKAKGVNIEIENAGVSGDTSSGGLSRLDWSIPDGTDGVILELGANDMLRGVDPAVTKKSLDAI